MRNGLLLLGVLGLAIAGWWLSGGSTLHADDPRLATGNDGVVMLAAEWCGYCRRQEAEFKQAGVAYTRLDVDSFDGQKAMAALGARGVPVTVIGQDVVRGYDTRRLKQHLTPLGYRIY